MSPYSFPGIEIDEPRPITVESIKQIVCKSFDMPYQAFTDPIKKPDYVEIRFVAMWCANKYIRWKQFNWKQTLSSIGKHFVSSSHCNVLYGIRQVDNRIQTEPTFKLKMVKIEKEINSLMKSK